MTRLFACVRGKRPEFCPNNMFMHLDFPVHKTPLSRQYMAKATTDRLKDPSYSPDSAVNDSWLFPK